jgi:GNAT superfamily N-acetyltransferase
MGGTGRMAGVRDAALRDARELARLFTELGHAATEDDIVSRWNAWHAGGNVGIVVDGAEGELIGAATLHQAAVLHRPKPIGRISALIVDARHRHEGIGRALVDAAEQMFRDAGCGMIEITSHMRRTDAHAFYAHLGYELTSARFMKPLA